MTHEQEILWLAGLLEGEATFAYRKGHGIYISLAMTDEDIVKRVANIWGIKSIRKVTPKHTNWSDFYVVRIFGDKAVSIMKQILPFMGMRRSAKIEEVLNLWVTRRTASEAAIRARARGKRCPKTANLFVVAS